MKRICFVLHVKPDRLEEYKLRHCDVWPEMLAALRETGWNNYTLFLRPDGLLVGYLVALGEGVPHQDDAGRPLDRAWTGGA